MPLKEIAEIEDIGIYLIIQESDYASNGFGIHLCLDCADKREITEYDNFSFIRADDGMLPTECDDCGIRIV